MFFTGEKCALVLPGERASAPVCGMFIGLADHPIGCQRPHVCLSLAAAVPGGIFTSENPVPLGGVVALRCCVPREGRNGQSRVCRPLSLSLCSSATRFSWPIALFTGENRCRRAVERRIADVLLWFRFVVCCWARCVP